MSPVQVKINIFICQPTPPTTHALNNIMLYCHQASNSSTSDISFVAISVPAAWVHHADSLTATLQLRSIYMKMSPHVSFISPKVCTAIKPQFNFIYNALSPLSSVVSPICSMTSPCQLFTETLQKLHSPITMKMPPENIDILNLLMNEIMKNATVAPSAEPPRII